MKQFVETLVRFALWALICYGFWLASVTHPSDAANLVAVAGTVLTFPVAWLGRRILDRRQTVGHAEWVTTFVHFGLGLSIGVPVVRLIVAPHAWPGWVLPVPRGVGLTLVIVSGAAAALVVLNLAWKGLGAPFFIALSRKLAVDWMYAWTRNPMVLGAIAFFLSLAIWLQSWLFVIWVVIPFTPAILFFIRVYEERELERRFGASYLEYRSRTPMLLPRRPRPATSR